MARALLIIDIQNDYFPGGAFPLVEPEAAAANAAALLGAFRAGGEPVVHLQHLSGPEDPFFVPGTPGVEIHASVAPAGEETVLQKAEPNGFLGTGLEEELRGRGVEELVVAGMMSSMCVDATVRAAADKGFAVQLVRGAGPGVRRRDDRRRDRPRRVHGRPGQRLRDARRGRGPDRAAGHRNLMPFSGVDRCDMSRSTAVAVAASTVVLAVLAVPAVAPAKGDARATIQAPTRCDAEPGDRITIRFRLTVAAHGTSGREPFGAADVFVRLRRAPGVASFRRDARPVDESKGVYTVRVTVPRGGIRRIDVGIDGVRYDADGTTTPAPSYLPVVGDPCRLAA